MTMVRVRAISQHAAACCAASYVGLADYGYVADYDTIRWYVIYYDM
jgi:hypothetical protein